MMYKKLIIPALLILLNSFEIFAQQPEEQKVSIKFSGFIKNDFILDSRQTISAREGHFLLFPSDIQEDKEGEDINARASFNYLAIQTRLRVQMTGPDAFGAQTTGMVEGAFFGQSDIDINGFRLRHAFVKLDWGTTKALTGQYWHILFHENNFPNTVSFNTGVPFHYFSRNPQIRLIQEVGNITLTGVVAAQRDFSSPGGSGLLRNALLPDLGGRMQINFGDNAFAGLTASYKRLVPRLSTDSLYKTTQAVEGLIGTAFAKFNTTPVTIKAEASYVQNGFDGLMAGGFIVNEITNIDRDYRNYEALNSVTGWIDLETTGKKVVAGLFMAYLQNLGTTNPVVAPGDVFNSSLKAYTRTPNIASAFRISPRLMVNSGKARISFELEHTAAQYGKDYDNHAVPINTHWVSNSRLLVAVYYFF